MAGTSDGQAPTEGPRKAAKKPTDEEVLAEALRKAAEQPTEELRERARERARRVYARKGVVQIGAFGGLFGIPVVLVALEAVGALPAWVTSGPLSPLLAVGIVMAGVYGWAEGARRFLRLRDRIDDRRYERRQRASAPTTTADAPREAAPAPAAERPHAATARERVAAEPPRSATAPMTPPVAAALAHRPPAADAAAPPARKVDLRKRPPAPRR